jgi:hypothetical protein
LHPHTQADSGCAAATHASASAQGSSALFRILRMSGIGGCKRAEVHHVVVVDQIGNPPGAGRPCRQSGGKALPSDPEGVQTPRKRTFPAEVSWPRGAVCLEHPTRN